MTTTYELYPLDPHPILFKQHRQQAGSTMTLYTELLGLLIPVANANLVVTTVHTDPASGLTVQAWPRSDCSWYLLFRVKDQYSLTLNETAVFYMFRRLTGYHTQPPGGWARWAWQPVGHSKVAPSAIAAVKAWLTEQEAKVCVTPCSG
jgi:hypothetical protein